MTPEEASSTDGGGVVDKIQGNSNDTDAPSPGACGCQSSERMSAPIVFLMLALFVFGGAMRRKGVLER